MTTSILAFVIVLGILIFFHELGHFLVARLFGVGVERFSLGFGPRLFGKTIGITDYRVSAIPLGGYVKMVGEEPDMEMDPADIPISFTHKSVYKRILIVAAGPAFNLLLAVLIYFVIFLVSGMLILHPSIGGIEEGSPAQAIGLQKGDRILAIDRTDVKSWEEMAERISASRGKELELTVQRDGSVFTTHAAPKIRTTRNIFGEEIERHVIGISASGEFYSVDLGPFGALTEAVSHTYSVAKLTVISVAKIIQGAVSPRTLGGPIMIAQMAGQQADEGAANLVYFIALLSINLAILNFLPIPVLDGGHLVFFFIEAVIGRPVSTKMREIAQQAGIFMLILLMVYVFYNDIARIFFG
jgi:regulator of sigma E protease